MRLGRKRRYTIATADAVPQDDEATGAVVQGQDDDENQGRVSRYSNQFYPVFFTNALGAGEQAGKPGQNGLGTFDGVFIPVWLTIFGVIVFVRWGFIISYAGIFGTLTMLFIAYLVNMMTTLSLAAISTNGTIKGRLCCCMEKRPRAII